VQTKLVPRNLILRPTTKNIAQMSVAVLLQIEELWKSIMRKKQLGVAFCIKKVDITRKFKIKEMIDDIS